MTPLCEQDGKGSINRKVGFVDEYGSKHALIMYFLKLFCLHFFSLYFQFHKAAVSLFIPK